MSARLGKTQATWLTTGLVQPAPYPVGARRSHESTLNRSAEVDSPAAPCTQGQSMSCSHRSGLKCLLDVELTRLLKMFGQIVLFNNNEYLDGLRGAL